MRVRASLSPRPLESHRHARRFMRQAMPPAVGFDSDDANSAVDNGGSITLYLGHLPEEACRNSKMDITRNRKYNFIDRDRLSRTRIYVREFLEKLILTLSCLDFYRTWIIPLNTYNTTSRLSPLRTFHSDIGGFLEKLVLMLSSFVVLCYWIWIVPHNICNSTLRLWTFRFAYYKGKWDIHASSDRVKYFNWHCLCDTQRRIWATLLITPRRNSPWRAL